MATGKTLFTLGDERNFQKHPVFEGVSISKLVARAECDSLGISILKIAPGAEIGVHTHDASLDSIYVLSGEGEAYINGGWKGFSTGDHILVPARVKHGIRNTGSAPLELFVAHAPPLF